MGQPAFLAGCGRQLVRRPLVVRDEAPEGAYTRGEIVDVGSDELHPALVRAELPPRGRKLLLHLADRVLELRGPLHLVQQCGCEDRYRHRQKKHQATAA